MTLFTLPIDALRGRRPSVASGVGRTSAREGGRYGLERRRNSTSSASGLRGAERLFGQAGGGAVRIGLDDGVPGFARAIQLPQVPERHTLQVVRIGNRVAHGVRADHLVERFDGFVVLGVLE